METQQTCSGKTMAVKVQRVTGNVELLILGEVDAATKRKALIDDLKERGYHMNPLPTPARSYLNFIYLQ